MENLETIRVLTKKYAKNENEEKQIYKELQQLRRDIMTTVILEFKKGYDNTVNFIKF